MTAAARASAAYFEPKIGARAVSVLPGRHAVIDEPELCVTTLLGRASRPASATWSEVWGA